MTAEEYDRITAHARMTQSEYDRQIKIEVQCHTIEGWQHAKFCRNVIDADAYIQSLPRGLHQKLRVIEIPANKYRFHKN